MDRKNDFEKLGNFIKATGAARVLLRMSHKQGFLIEALVLYAALVDGFCRIAIVLKQQIKDKTSKFDIRYIYQDEKDRDYYSERDIYELAYKKHVIEEDLFNEINALYDFRNKAIHRFFISEIEYNHLGIILDKYELVYQRLWNIVYELESKQICAGTGMTISRKFTNKDRDRIQADISEKIDSKKPEKLRQILGLKLIKNIETFSESTERERIAEEISDEIEVREEKTRIPPGIASVKEITIWAKRKKLFEKCVCGHEKIHHINLNKPKENGKNLEEYIKRCKIKGCKCKVYVNSQDKR